MKLTANVVKQTERRRRHSSSKNIWIHTTFSQKIHPVYSTTRAKFDSYFTSVSDNNLSTLRAPQCAFIRPTFVISAPKLGPLGANCLWIHLQLPLSNIHLYDHHPPPPPPPHHHTPPTRRVLSISLYNLTSDVFNSV